MLHNFTGNLDRNKFHLCSLLRKKETNAQDYPSYYIGFLWIICIVLGVLVPVAVAGNALVLAVIWRTPALKTPSYILLGGLAFTDLCTGLIIQPLFIVCLVSDLKDNKPVLCTAGVVSSILGTYMSCSLQQEQ